mmetsp:Transcript_19290/g.52995  ORF Transcript_19290/g.52995 Transcript_19290/m.52995 type:complete len:506 (-) Transcript_19290:2725-4242(-)|eukprot:CAMPEP_0168743096 /NCGR_PEP_ID=MMETSP0724-20121128/13384_1 /TAXON_ID=265536 /ORGANISM="Amphiprora sp., Strain CCMP467" /LENGTH=505 /DNA_ID=CAMNT_0008790683 /DNA_START=13 /DNA_END=1530 /DNA_ORIENTATION=+
MTPTESLVSGTKRPLAAEEDTPSSFFLKLADWIRSSKGGFVHPDVEFVDETRELRLSTNAVGIPEGDIVFRIPRPNLVNPSTATKWSKIPQLLGQMHQGKDGLFHSSQDCIVAAYLASKPVNIQPYLDSLPSKSSLDTLPRRWRPEKLGLLGGSPLLRRIKEQQHEIKKDFARIQQCLAGVDGVPPIDFQSFDDAMACVTSRAFAGKTFDKRAEGSEESTMVPLLDLCNHERGTMLPKKNLSYEFEPDHVLVRSKGIAKGDALRITYGAQGNAQLLFNYGFAIPNNFEPDGSSNDTYEFFPTNDEASKAVFLRMGPKSYSYGCFVQALEMFIDTHSPSNGETENYMNGDAVDDLAGGPDDMEAFLNECDEENLEGEEDDVMAMYSMGLKEGVEDEEEDQPVQEELKALKAFRSRLILLSKSYAVPDKERIQHLKSANHSSEKYAAVVVISELSTIHFFARAIEAIIAALDSKQSFSDSLPPLTTEGVVNENHVSDLLDVYMKIRH